MDVGRFDAWTRRRFGLGVSGLAAGLLGVAAGGETLARKKKKGSPLPNPCAGKNLCQDDSHTCGEAGAACYVKQFGGNICGRVVASVSSCDECTSEQECVLGLGCLEDYYCAEPA